MSTTPSQPWRSDGDAVFVARLWHFNAKLRVYSLDDHCTVIRVTKKEVAQIRSAERSPGSLVAPPLGALVAPSFGSEITPGELAVKAITSGASYEDAKARANHGFLSLIRSLRLLKPGSPYIGEGIAYQPGIPSSSRYYWLWEGLLLPVAYSGDYEFERSERSTLRAIYRGVRTVSSRVEMALGRFDMAYSRELDKDRLIDYWVALEALFSPSDRQELKYRLRLRTAYFVTSDPDERQSIYDVLGDSYDARSAVVHGREPEANLRAVCSQTEDVLRRTLRKIVMSPEPYVPEGLDRAIARGGPGGVVP